jgi:hypothetical protein
MKTKMLALLTVFSLAVLAFGEDPYHLSKPGEKDAGGNPIPPGSKIFDQPNDLKTMQIAFCNGPHGDLVWIRADILAAMSKAEADKLITQVCEQPKAQEPKGRPFNELLDSLTLGH